MKSSFQNHFMQIIMIFTASGVDCCTVISSIDTGFALPPIADFEKLITPKTKAILICNPGNPVVICIQRGNDATSRTSEET
jgi:aspartate/methionine/tyrosine aminotransferase